MKRNRNYFGLVECLACILMLVVALSSSNLAHAQNPAVVSVSAPSNVNPGEVFSVNISVQPDTAIAGVQFDMTFNSSLVSVDNVAEGTLLSQGGATTYFNSGIIDNEAGIADGVVGAITTPGQTVSTEAIFATITMIAGAESGTCTLSLSNVVVGDINGQSVPISVVNGNVKINQAPVLNPIGDKSGNEGELITFSILATDADSDNLTYSVSSLPSGATFSSSTRTFSWTPRYDQAGVYTNVNFKATDGFLTDSEAITITVAKLYEDWDVNGDAAANVLDMIIIGQHWNETGLTGWIREDTNEDGAINVLDMILVGQNWTG